MADLEERSYTAITESISAANVGDLVHWLGARIPSNGFAYGAVQMPPAQAQSDAWGAVPALYGEWSHRLRAEVVHYLLHALPASLAADPAPVPVGAVNGAAAPVPLQHDPRLMAAYVPLPFELFKKCIESDELPIAFIQDRFAFAKRAIAARKKLAVAQAQAAGGPTAAAFEEGVVLALKSDGGDGMGVHITRKPKRGRNALWKVEG
jgi:hypothetical protein